MIEMILFSCFAFCKDLKFSNFYLLLYLNYFYDCWNLFLLIKNIFRFLKKIYIIW